jgi:hypothetical protein
MYLVRGPQFEKQNVERDVREVYKTIAGNKIVDPLLILIEPPKATILKDAQIVRSEQEAANVATA